MLNEPNPEAGPAGPAGSAGDTPGGSHMSYIQVTPLEKEAIERVRRSTTLANLFLTVQSSVLLYYKCWNVMHNPDDVFKTVTLIFIFHQVVNMRNKL